ncbi:MAG TPA: radical SAM/SPASM domain-containing protein, partial [Dehalococcoidia bacterium]|nr:radical SAM/SPASM domain-containing protein [Dehalococcoidia bacterium]
MPTHTQTEQTSRPAGRFPTDFGRTPFLVIWEVTRACALACVHCRADAVAKRDARELDTDEGMALIDQIRALGDPPPLLVLTGGDPMWRKDLT